MKFCVDCKHHRYRIGGHACYHPNGTGHDLVTGMAMHSDAESQRQSVDGCGHTGKWFEQKNIRRLFGWEWPL